MVRSATDSPYAVGQVAKPEPSDVGFNTDMAGHPPAHATTLRSDCARRRGHGERFTMTSTADSHDLIRVHGERANNLRNVSVDLPKRRLTVFTGVSGSGKSSLGFDTLAAESQRLINETYSAFLQGFMPSLNRPEVDRLEGLTTAIIVDQESLGANPRSTVGTVTDANALLRIMFSRLGQPQIGSPSAFSFNVPTVISFTLSIP